MWTQLIQAEIEDTYGATQGLLDQVDDEALDWKPATGSNWMTMGQLLQHLTTACGFCCRGIVTGDWGMPEGERIEDLPPEDMLPSAERMPTAQRVASVKSALDEDRVLALRMVAEAGEARLADEPTQVPWDDAEMCLGRRLLHMVHHLASHKSQLFYYLKLQGKPVDTSALWGAS